MTTVRDFIANPTRVKRLALVVQGGGMRGVYSMGALTALEDAGLRDAFDVVIGSSAGANNSAYFLAGQAHEAVDIYVKYLSSRKFISPYRLKKIVDVDYLVDTVLKKKGPLNLERLEKSRSLLEVIVTNAETGKAEVVTNRDDYDFYEVIRATCALPALYNKKIKLGSTSYVDGGVVDNIPVKHAMQGADAVLAVLTHSPGYRRLDKGSTNRTITKLFARGQSKEVLARLGTEDALFNASMEMLEKESGSTPFRGWAVWPSDAVALVGRDTIDPGKLRKCADMGRKDMQKLLTSELDKSWLLTKS